MLPSVTVVKEGRMVARVVRMVVRVMRMVAASSECSL